MCTSAPSAADGALTAMASTFGQAGSVAGTAPRIGREHKVDMEAASPRARVRKSGSVHPLEGERAVIGRIALAQWFCVEPAVIVFVRAASPFRQPAPNSHSYLPTSFLVSRAAPRLPSFSNRTASLSNMSGGNRLLVATAAFRNEPF